MVSHTAFGFIHSLKDFCSMMLGPTKILCSIMFHEKRKFRERLDTRIRCFLLVSVLHQFVSKQLIRSNTLCPLFIPGSLTVRP